MIFTRDKLVCVNSQCQFLRICDRMTSAADSGVETGNDSNDSTIQEKLFKMDLESPKQLVSQDNANPAENPQEVPAKPPNSSGIVSVPANINQTTHITLSVSGSNVGTVKVNFPPESLSYLQPSSLMHGYESVSGVFVSGGPLGTQYRHSELISKLRSAACLRHHALPRFKCLRRTHSSTSPFGNYMKSRETTRMLRAVCQNNTNFVREMLETGQSPNVRDEYKRTPLHLAACMGYADMVKLLLDHGADPNAQDSIGNTPLHLAACTNHVAVITLLLKAGTRVSAANSPLKLAITKFNLIKRSSAPHPVLKEQVAQVIAMLTEYMKRNEAPNIDAELLNKFESLVRVSDSSEQVENNIRDLLDNLGALDISKSS